MATRRLTGEPCPDVQEVVAMRVCQPCPYFRGAVSEGKGWMVACNWPRNGSAIARGVPLDDLTADEIVRWTSPTS